MYLYSEFYFIFAAQFLYSFAYYTQIINSECTLLTGFPMSIYVIMDGVVLHQLLDPNFEKNLPVIPSEVTSVNFTWKAGENRNYTYEFYELRSHNKDILNSPIISISPSGPVPRKPTIFEVLIPCVGNTSGVATFTLGLRIYNLDAGQNLATIRLNLQKQCSYRGPDPECDKKCGKNGKCSRDTFQCVCATGIWRHFARVHRRH